MRGTTASTAAKMRATVAGRRPSTGGKNVQSTARRKSAMSQTKGEMVGRSIKGPDLGNG